MKNVNLIASLSVAMLGLAAVLITIAGCSPTATQTPAAASAPAKPDPVAAIKNIITVVQRDGAASGSQRYVASDLAYDAKKTDSLLSPYTATVKFQSQNPQRGSDATDKYYDVHMIANLAWQDDKWVLKDVERQVHMPNAESIMDEVFGNLRRKGEFWHCPAKYSDGHADEEVNAWWTAFGGKEN